MCPKLSRIFHADSVKALVINARLKREESAGKRKVEIRLWRSDLEGEEKGETRVALSKAGYNYEQVAVNKTSVSETRYRGIYIVMLDCARF